MPAEPLRAHLPRILLLATLPLVAVGVIGALLWTALWAVELGALSPAEAGPALPLALGTVLGGRFTGTFANVGSEGVWAVGLLAPMLLACLAARFLPRGARGGTVALGSIVTAACHAATVALLALSPVYDPTSFELASVSWVPVSSFVFAGTYWATAWVISVRTIARPVAIALTISGVLGAGVGSGLVLGQTDAAGLVVAAVGGALLGPNLLGLGLLWGLGAEVAELGGRGGPSPQSYGEVATELGRWLWAVPAAAAALLVGMGVRITAPTSAADFNRRARDVALTLLVAVPALVLLASPRVSAGRPSSPREEWLGVAEAPTSLVVPTLLVGFLVLVPQVVRAVRRGETWPQAPVRLLTGLMTPRPVPSRRTTGRHVGQPGHPSLTGPPSPDGVAPPVTRAGGAPEIEGLSASSGQPPSNPFGAAPPPPVGGSWEHIAPAVNDPGSSTAAPTAGLAGAPADALWRSAPPPVMGTEAESLGPHPRTDRP